MVCLNWVQELGLVGRGHRVDAICHDFLSYLILDFRIKCYRIQLFQQDYKILEVFVLLLVLVDQCLLSDCHPRPEGLCEPICFFVLKCHKWWVWCRAASFYGAMPHSRNFICGRSTMWCRCKHWKGLSPFHHKGYPFLPMVFLALSIVSKAIEAEVHSRAFLAVGSRGFPSTSVSPKWPYISLHKSTPYMHVWCGQPCQLFIKADRPNLKNKTSGGQKEQGSVRVQFLRGPADRVRNGQVVRSTTHTSFPLAFSPGGSGRAVGSALSFPPLKKKLGSSKAAAAAREAQIRKKKWRMPKGHIDRSISVNPYDTYQSWTHHLPRAACCLPD